jgi:hypothetical protein
MFTLNLPHSDQLFSFLFAKIKPLAWITQGLNQQFLFLFLFRSIFIPTEGAKTLGSARGDLLRQVQFPFLLRKHRPDATPAQFFRRTTLFRFVLQVTQIEYRGTGVLFPRKGDGGRQRTAISLGSVHPGQWCLWAAQVPRITFPSAVRSGEERPMCEDQSSSWHGVGRATAYRILPRPCSICSFPSP